MTCLLAIILNIHYPKREMREKISRKKKITPFKNEKKHINIQNATEAHHKKKIR